MESHVNAVNKYLQKQGVWFVFKKENKLNQKQSGPQHIRPHIFELIPYFKKTSSSCQVEKDLDLPKLYDDK